MTRMYDVFGRAKPGAQLHHLGSLSADDEHLAQLYASQLFARRGENVDLVIAPREHLLQVGAYARVLNEHALRLPRSYNSESVKARLVSDLEGMSREQG
jgi:1,2-phenylacetyl-CoA epoxidase PaaB subunit